MTSRTFGALPGDLSTDETIDRMIRVDHAGEYGAARIYAGQLAVLRNSPKAGLLRQMRDQEQAHLDAFTTMIADRRVRPTALLPLWHVAGFALGAATAVLGERAAMACTVAIEDTIDAHYTAQIDRLAEVEAPLRHTAPPGETAAPRTLAETGETTEVHTTAPVRETAPLGKTPSLRETIEKFRGEEQEHRATALANGAERAPGYRLLSAAIRTGCRLAIRLSERL